MTARVTSGETLDTIAGDQAIGIRAALIRLAPKIEQKLIGEAHVTTVEAVLAWLHSSAVTEALTDQFAQTLRENVADDDLPVIYATRITPWRDAPTEGAS